MDPIQLAKKLIRVPSLTGEEARIFEVLAYILYKAGYRTHAIWTAKGRPNLIAYKGKPDIIFCSHLDTVPPYIGLREDKKYLYGRGACDTKGVIAAQIVSAFELNKQGINNIGFIFVVGEEVDHRGAIDVAKKFPFSNIKAIIVGEPTDNKLAVATKGILKVILQASGKAAHSAYPKLGHSAIHPLVEALNRIQQLKLPSHRVLGKSDINIGTIQGGVAANVFAAYAEAHVLIRTVTPSKGILKKIKQICGSKIRVTVDSINDPIQLQSQIGFKKTVVAFNTDVPYLKKHTKKIFLFGPGSILDAHRPDERISKNEIIKAVPLYIKLVKSLI